MLCLVHFDTNMPLLWNYDLIKIPKGNVIKFKLRSPCSIRSKSCVANTETTIVCRQVHNLSAAPDGAEEHTHSFSTKLKPRWGALNNNIARRDALLVTDQAKKEVPAE
jgi:hypothetical protein